MGRKKKSGEPDRSISATLDKLLNGFEIVRHHPFLSGLDGFRMIKDSSVMGKETAAYVTSRGEIPFNEDYNLEPEEWAYI